MSINLDSLLSLGLPNTVALATVAVIGYMVGVRNRQAAEPAETSDDIARATAIAQQLEGIADELRKDLAFHRNRVERFKKKLRQAATEDETKAWQRLREEAEEMLGPTLDLVGQLSTAYDRIRVQSKALTNYTGSRTDPLTGLYNGRALEEQLETLLKTHPLSSPIAACSVAVVSLEKSAPRENLKGAPLELLGKALGRQLRGSDFAARYGADELVVVMPKTQLNGSAVFGRRFRSSIEVQLGMQLCVGLAESQPGETAKALLARADAALYSARATCPGAIFLHSGGAIRADQREPQANADTAGAQDHGAEQELAAAESP